jgi:excisionase family DNA binding protein
MGKPLERLLTRDEAAEILRASPRFMRRLISERRIRFVYVGRTPHIPESAIADYIEQHTVRPVAVRWRGGKVAA